MQDQLADFINSYSGGIDKFYEDFFPGYQRYIPNVQPGDFNRMIFHMITDEYAEINGISPVTTVTEGTKIIAKRHYKCDELWPKWVTTVRIIDELTGGGDSYDVAKAFSTAAGGNDVLNNHFNDNFDPPFGGRLFKWIFELVLSGRMRDFSGGNFVTAEIKQNLPYLFLQATGFKFARIKDNWEARGANYKVLPEDQTEYDTKTLGTNEIKDLPFIHCPVFAFKYFEYYSRTYSVRKWWRWVKRYDGWEPCERFLNYGLDVMPAPSECIDNEEMLKLFGDWDFADRELFYRSLSSLSYTIHFCYKHHLAGHTH